MKTSVHQMFKEKILRQFVNIVALGILSLTGCSQSTLDESIKATAPIKLGRAGEKASIVFSTQNNESHEKNKLLIGVSLVTDGRLVNVDLLRESIPIFKVKITNIEPKSERSVHFFYFKTKDFSSKLEPSKNGAAIVFAEYFASHDYFLAYIDRNQNGKYNIDIEVVNNNPQLSSLQFEAFVDYRIYGGK